MLLLDVGLHLINQWNQLIGEIYSSMKMKDEEDIDIDIDIDMIENK